MKLFTAIIVGLASSIATASQPFVSTGIGFTLEKARQDAINKASLTYCGVSVLSDKKVKNYTIQNTKVTIYNSCRVVKTNIISENKTADGYTSTLELFLEKANQSKRLFNQAEIYNQFTASELQTTAKSYVEEKNSGDRFIEQVMEDFPVHAFEILDHRKPYVTDDESRNLFLVIPYTVIWNSEFLDAMQTTLKEFSANKKWYQSYKDLEGIPFKFYDKKGTIKQFNLLDENRFKIIIERMRGQYEPYLLAKVYDAENHVLNKSCIPLLDSNNRSMYQIFHPYYEVHIYSNQVAQNYITFPIDNRTKINNVEIELVAKKDCKN